MSGRTAGAWLRAVRRAGCWAAHLPAARPRRPWTWWPPALWAAGWARCSRSCWSWWTCSTKVSPALPRAELRVPGTGGSGARGGGRGAGRRAGGRSRRRPGPSRGQGDRRAARLGRRPGAPAGRDNGGRHGTGAGRTERGDGSSQESAPRVGCVT